MIILGIDPALRTTGFGVIEKQGSRLRYIASGTIKTGNETALPPRLKVILSSIGEVIATYRPACAAIRARASWCSENSGSAATRISTWSRLAANDLVRISSCR